MGRAPRPALLLACGLALAPIGPGRDAQEGEGTHPGRVRSHAGRAGTLIVLNKSDDTASLIDPESGEVRAVVATGTGPHEVAVSPDGSLAVVTNYGGGRSLTLIDLEAGEAAGRIELPGAAARPHGIVFRGDTGRMLVTAEGHRALLEVDLAEARVVRSIETAQVASHMVAVTPDGARAFVANIGSGTLSAIDLEAGALLANIATGAGCEGVAVTPDGAEVWSANRAADTVSVVDARTLEVRAELESPGFPIRVAITPDGARALVSCATADTVAVYDVATRTRTKRIAMAFEPVEGSEEHLFGRAFADKATPIGILIPPDGTRAFVANANSNLVAILDLATLEVTGTLATGREPDGLAWAPR